VLNPLILPSEQSVKNGFVFTAAEFYFTINLAVFFPCIPKQE